MKELLKDILDNDGVNGVIILTDEGKSIFEDISSKISMNPNEIDWNSFIDAIRGYREVELMYERGLIYVRKIEFGFMIVFMEIYTQMAMVRLNCDIVLPSLQDLKENKKYKQLFKR